MSRLALDAFPYGTTINAPAVHGFVRALRPRHERRKNLECPVPGVRLRQFPDQGQVTRCVRRSVIL